VDGVRHSASQSVTTPITNSAPLLIGKWGSGGFNGIIDNVKIYNYALSDKQINNNYNKNQKLSYFDTGSGETWTYNAVASDGTSYVNEDYVFSVAQTDNENITLFSYDANGNLLSDETYYYEYNSYNQLYQVKVDNSSGRILERYYYDENGQRAVKVHYFVGGTNETVYYIGKDFVRVVNASGTFDTVYYYDSKNLVAEKKPNGQFVYYHPDHIGSSSLITNSSGGVVEKTTYEPFGSVFSGGMRSRYDYTGKEGDQTGLQYYGARYRNPKIIIFTQPDQNIPAIYNPQSLNRYSYTLNNPYRYTDPDGNVPVDTILDAGFIIFDVGMLIHLGSGDNNENWKALGMDIMGTMVPYGTGFGNTYRMGKTAEKANEVVKLSENVIDVGKSVSKSNKASRFLYTSLETANKLSPQQIGDIGESKLASRVGGESQKHFKTELGGRYVDQFADGVAYESKVGYTSRTQTIRNQIAKDVQLMKTGQVDSIVWEFHRSPVTGKIGPSKPLAEELTKHEIVVRYAK
jgi:RHS repeat-associated protein